MSRPLLLSTSPALLLLLGMALISCSSNEGKDANTDVFKTPEQAAATRKEKLLLDWQELTCRIANARRPDIKTQKHPKLGFAILLSADNVEYTIDLNPLASKLIGAAGKERDTIIDYLAKEVPAFDRIRLKAMGFEQASRLLYPVLASDRQTQALATPGLREMPIVNRVVIDLNWLPVIRWPGSEAQTAIDPELVSTWRISEAVVNNAAIANLKRDFIGMAEAYDTIDLPSLGRYGTFKGASPAEFILLPELLTGVRRAWETGDDLVVFAPTRNTVMFVQSKNTKLLDMLWPEWSKLYGKASEPLLGHMMLLNEKGLSLFTYTPAKTQPASKPTTKPKPYIVR